MTLFSKNIIKKFSYFIYILLAFLLVAPIKLALADAYGLDTAAGGAGLTNPSIATILGNVAGAMAALAGSIFLFLVIYGGIIMMTSQGGEGVGKGKKIITWAIIGALVLGAAYAITTLVFGVFTPPAK